MVAVSEGFREFVDFRAPISAESVHELLDNEQFQLEFTELRDLAGADRGANLRKWVAPLARDAEELSAARQQIESDQREAACPGQGAEHPRENGAAQSGKYLARHIKD